MISQDCQPCAAPTLAMKTHRHLYPRIYDFGNLYQAFRQARPGGSALVLWSMPTPPGALIRPRLVLSPRPSSCGARTQGTNDHALYLCANRATR